MSALEIIDYVPEYRDDFERLNREWIEQHWELEDSDHAIFANPSVYVIDRGGAILLARCDHTIIGTCALVNMGDAQYELAKMCITADYQGRGFGKTLCQAAISRAQQLGAQRLILESNSVLGPAIALYRTLGFADISDHDSPYARCNVQMEIRFNEA